ncbi:efflux RND transporter permease subunit [Phaeobacter sp.]|uniref:efflux RND transporter permease subunit n=1 Tax=Phaeobacter sp. TaxID=1902409 RepID=UPI0025EE0798|nr:efflux RND transporter permease subunit [Phaeobacter sp.]
MSGSLASLTWRNPRIVALILLVILAAGLSSLWSIGRQEDPTITNLFATVKTPYPGAEPARVEALVTAEIEEALREISEVDVIASTSATGISIVSIELDETIAKSRIEQVWSEVRDALSEASDDFPSGAAEPELNTDGAGAYGVIVALTSNHDGVPLALLSRMGDVLADQLRNVPGTSLVDVFGQPEEEVTVTLHAGRSAALGITADDVAAAIAAADPKISAGKVSNFSDELVVEVAGEIDALSRLQRIVLRDGSQGAMLRLGDIATFDRGPRLPASELAFQDGRPAILVAAKLNEGLQVDRWAQFVGDALASFAATLPHGMELTRVFDQSSYTSDRLAEVGYNMLVGVGLVIAVLLCTLGRRSAIIVAIILPVVTLASVATMNAIALPIHQMSVTGLVVALGLLVDAGIVMTDEIGRHIQNGVTRLRAVEKAVKRLTLPLFASTATTALSFTPMILLPGGAGDFVGAIAIAVVIMLSWSFLVAITVTPALAGWVLPSQASGSWANGLPSGVAGRLFRATLLWAAHNPIRSISMALVLPVLGFATLPLLTAQFFPGVDRDQFHIEVDLASGTALSQTQSVVTQLDVALRAEPGIESVTWTVGTSAPAFYYNIAGGRDAAPAYAQALVRTSSAAVTAALLPKLEQTLPVVAPEAQVLVRGLVQGPPVSAPVEIRLVGPDIAVLREEGEKLRRIMIAEDAVSLARATIAAGAPKLEIDVDEAEARRLGLSLSDVARQLDAALVGRTGGSLVEGTEELPVRVRMGERLRGDPALIRDMAILPAYAAETAATGAHPGVPLSAIAEVVLTPGDGSITRRNGERVNTVQAFLLNGVLPEEALSQIRTSMTTAGYALPPGYRIEVGGDSDERASTVNNLLAPLGLIITLSIAVIVFTLNSFRLATVALVVSGLAAGLSILALAIFNFPFGITAIIGLIGSIGVSINAALIIMTALQEDERAASGEPDAMTDVIMKSSRHIVSTTITTFGGFLPLILAGGGFWPPFAVAVAGGVLLSTIISFYFVPPAFRLVYAKRNQSKPDQQIGNKRVTLLQAAE